MEEASRARERLGRYELLHRLAVGGMAEVFVARERGIAGVQRLVALKRLLPDHVEQPGAVELFIDEARIAAQLAHPNIVQVHAFGNERGTYLLAMELVAGQNLDKLFARAIARGAPLGRALAVHAVAEMLRGLAHAHAARDDRGAPLDVVHRDISPHNVLVSYAGDVKLMDFGIARAANRSHRTRTGVVRGKPAYMSPEQLAGEVVDARTDVYATGVLLWELTLGRRLFTGDDLAIAAQVAAGAIPAPRTIDPAYPPQLEEILMAAVRPRREDRIGDAGAFERALRAWLGESEPAGGHAAALGALMRGLFADEARAIEAVIHDAAHDEAPPAAEVVEPTEPLAEAPPTRSLRAPEPPTAPPAPPARASRSRLRVAVPAAIAVAGGIGVWRLVRAPAPESPVIAAPPPAAAPIEPARSAPPDANLDAAIAETAPGPAPAPAPASSERAAPPRAPERAQRPSRGAPPPRVARADLATRLRPESLVGLGKRFVTACEVRGAVLPPRVTFDLRIDKFGRVIEATLSDPADPAEIDRVAAACMHRWMMRWPFASAEREASGELTVAIH